MHICTEFSVVRFGPIFVSFYIQLPDGFIYVKCSPTFALFINLIISVAHLVTQN